MSEQHTLPLDFSIPSFPIRDLNQIASRARWILTLNKRTNSQISHVQKLIMDLIDIYWQEEREKEIQKMEAEAKERLAEHHWGEEGDEEPDLYPFALRHNRYGEFLEYVGDENEVDLQDLDDVEVLDEIIDWFADNESSEGFINAEPAEYFSAMTLWLIADAVCPNPFLDKNPDSTITLRDMSYIVQSAVMVMKSICYANQAEAVRVHQQKLEASEEKCTALEHQLILADNDLSALKNEKKVSSKKATDAKHARNRKASQLVCEDWLKNRANFKSAMKAAEHYQLWLEEQGYHNSLITVRNWILLHAKRHQIKW
ncbi:hypothetical protein [Siccibacter turicensis]|uniref:Uncharacterized protein n=1 Tax=Siccibacter turicensis TaxID=357233 RepID=A0A2P8VNR1_9ENTR|nr:hypothetical protein [Siccibacter turicensis]PSN09204.1 hypothetical protein C7G83_00135 [Siccibacter turicensis]